MKTRYFRSTLTGIVWRFSVSGNDVFAGVAGWIPTAMTLDGMRVSAVEINEEDAP